jgi:hypothetical protein
LLESGSSPISSTNGGHSDTVYYHLSPPAAQNIRDFGKKTIKHQKTTLIEHMGSSRTNIPEVFLTRLLMCKGTIQRFVNDFFDSVLFVGEDNEIPIVVKFVMDFLDQEARRNNVFC